MIAADASDPKGIVWIASYPKSGNTWIRLFIHHLIRIRKGRPASEREIDNLGDTAPSIAGQINQFEKFIGKPITEADMREVVHARPKVQEAVMREATGVLAAKTHTFLGRVFDTPLINLGISVGAVYVVRNPLDIAISLAPYLKISIDEAIRVIGMTLWAPPATALLAPEIWGSWSENVRSWTTDPPPPIKVVRYEDLIAEPVASFTEIAEHMRMGASRAEIEEAVDAASFERVAREEVSGGFVERPEGVGRFFRVGRDGQWRDALSPAQVKRIVADHAEQMGRFGYLPT